MRGCGVGLPGPDPSRTRAPTVTGATTTGTAAPAAERAPPARHRSLRRVQPPLRMTLSGMRVLGSRSRALPPLLQRKALADAAREQAVESGCRRHVRRGRERVGTALRLPGQRPASASPRPRKKKKKKKKKKGKKAQAGGAPRQVAAGSGDVIDFDDLFKD